MADIELQVDGLDRRETGGWWPPEGPRRAWATIGLVTVGLVTLSFVEGEAPETISSRDSPDSTRISPPEVRIVGLQELIEKQNSLVSELQTTNNRLEKFISPQHTTELIRQLEETHNQLVRILKEPPPGRGGAPPTIQVSTEELTKQIAELNKTHSEFVNIVRSWQTTAGTPTTTQVSITKLTEQINQLNENHSRLVKLLEGTSDPSFWKQIREISSSRTKDIVKELKVLEQKIQLVAKKIGNLELVCGGDVGEPCEVPPERRPAVNPAGCDFAVTVWDYRVPDGDLIDIKLEKEGVRTPLAKGYQIVKARKTFTHKLESGARYKLNIRAHDQGKVGRTTVEARFSHAARDSGRWALRKNQTETIELRCP